MTGDEKGGFSNKFFEERRALLKAMGMGAVALAAGASGSDATAQENAAWPIKKRFTLPPGTVVHFDETPMVPEVLRNPQVMGMNNVVAVGQGGPQLSIVDHNNRLCIGVNLPIGGRLDLAQMIFDGADPEELASDIGRARLIEKQHIITPGKDDPDEDRRPYIKLGETRVRDVSENSVAMMVTLKPGHRMALSNLPQTMIIPETNVTITNLDKQNKFVANGTVDSQRMILIIPKEEYRISMGGGLADSMMLKPKGTSKFAEDFDVLQQGMAIYSNTKELGQLYPGMKAKEAKAEFLAELKTRMMDTRTAMVADLLGREKNPKKEPVYSNEEVKQFSGKIYDAAVERGIIKPPAKAAPKIKPKKPVEQKASPDGIWENFIKKFTKELDEDFKRTGGKLLQAIEEKTSALPDGHTERLAARRNLSDLFSPGGNSRA